MSEALACRICGNPNLHPDPAGYYCHAIGADDEEYCCPTGSWTPTQEAKHVLRGESPVSTNGATKADLRRVIARLQAENAALLGGSAAEQERERIRAAISELNLASAVLEANGERWAVLERIRGALLSGNGEAPALPRSGEG